MPLEVNIYWQRLWEYIYYDKYIYVKYFVYLSGKTVSKSGKRHEASHSADIASDIAVVNVLDLRKILPGGFRCIKIWIQIM